MRKTFGSMVVMFAVFVACDSDEAGNSAPLPDAGMDPDSGVRPGDPDAAADASTQPDVGTDADAARPPAFELKSKEIDIEPSLEVTYCYHFTTPNTATLAVNAWKATMTPGVRSMVVFIGGSNQPAGTLTGACPSIAGASVSDPPFWVFAAYEPTSELVFPSDDGTEKPLAFELPAGARGYIKMHHVNTTAQTMKAHVTLSAEALPEGAAFTKTSPLVTYDDRIAIPAFSTDAVEEGTCNTVPDTKFWAMTMRTHKQGTRMRVKNGATTSANVAYENTNWSKPPHKTWANPFYTFDQNKLSFECLYTNPTNRTIPAGENPGVDETCMSMGYYFPATKPVMCFCTGSGCINL